MQIVTLLTDPAAVPGLDRDTVTALRDAWSGDAPRWLDAGRAAEFTVARIPDNVARVRDDLRSRRIDLALQPAAGRRKRLLLADMDSTMIPQECIDELAAEAGLGAGVAEITARAMNGEMEFEAALRARVALLAGLDIAVIDRVLATRIGYAAGGATLVATMKAAGAHTVLVSGGFTAFTAPVAAHLGFDEHRANVLQIDAGTLTGTVAEPILGREAKVAALEEEAARRGLTPTDAIAVGDGANDLGMLHRAGTGVALHAKPVVAAQCDIRIDFGDLTALLYLQGFAAAEFADPDADRDPRR